MAVINDIFAEIQIFISNYTFYFGTLTNILIILIFGLFVFYGAVRTTKLPKKLKKRGIIEYKQPDRKTMEDASKNLSDALKIPTITGNKKEIDNLILLLKDRYPLVFEKLNPVIMPSQSLIFVMKTKEIAVNDPILFCSHLDVVPEGNGKWKKPPFSGHDDKTDIWGRGALDCKGGMIAIFEAVNSLLSQGYLTKRDIYFAIGSDEETGGHQGAKKIAEYFENKQIHFDFILNDVGRITSAHMGSKLFPAALISVGEKSSVNILIKAKGEGGHSANLCKKSPVGIISEAVCRIENTPMKKRLLPCVERFLKASSPSMRYIQRFCLANNKLLKLALFMSFNRDEKIAPMFKTTFAATQVKGSDFANMLPNEAQAVINIRILQGDTVESVIEHIKSMVSDLDVEIVLKEHSEPSNISNSNTESYEIIRMNIEKHFGDINVIPTLNTRSSDAIHYRNLSQNIYGFLPIMMSPKQEKSIHNTNENIKKEALGVAVEFYKSIIGMM